MTVISKRLPILICLLSLVFMQMGCSIFGKKIRAFERQDLSHKGMEFIEHPIEEVSVQHMFNAREGSVGGFGGAGGGCGCN